MGNGNAFKIYLFYEILFFFIKKETTCVTSEAKYAAHHVVNLDDK